MAARHGSSKLSFVLLPAGDDVNGDEFLPRSLSDAVPENGGEGWTDHAKKPTRRKRRSKGSKKKIVAAGDSIAENAEAKESSSEPVDGRKPLADSNGFCTSPVRSRVFESRAIVADAATFLANRDPLVEPSHENGRCTVGSEPPIAQNRGNADDVGQFHVPFTTVVELRPDDSSGVTTMDSMVSENRTSGENVNILHEIFATPAEFRQRSLNGNLSGKDETLREENSAGPPNSSVNWKSETKVTVNRLQTVNSLDWDLLMAKSSDDISSEKKMPFRYFLGEINAGNAIRTTTSIGNERNRQRVYNTMFHVPWRCELLIDVGFFVCLDSFLSLLTIMPARILISIWRLLSTRQFWRPCTTEVSDFGCLVVLSCGIACLQGIDISLIYHVIRGQGIVKLYVVYNVLEIFDKLCQSFGEDVVQVLFNSAEGVANCSAETMAFQLMRFMLEQLIAVVAFIVHSFILLAQAITLSTAIVAHNNALLALLVSNNFAEVKSNVFKRLSKENLRTLAHHDTVERFHIMAFLLFVLAQNILEAEGSWFGSFLVNASLVYICEILIDIIKHSFLAKFNEIKPIAYSEFLEALCKQTLNMETDTSQKNLAFVPLAPACVVIRVVTPIYAAHLPGGPLPWRLFWIFLFSAMTYFMLAVLKIIVGIGLRLHAAWYIKRCEKKKQHVD